MNAPPPLLEKSNTGLDPNLAAAIAYVGWFVTGIALIIIEKDSRYVKFHALQSTFFFLPAVVLQMLLWPIPLIGWLLGYLVWIVSMVLWLVLMFKAYQGERFKLPFVGDLAEQNVK